MKGRRTMTNKAYWRRLIVRVIEDGIIFILAGASIWSLCYIVTGIFRLMGV